MSLTLSMTEKAAIAEERARGLSPFRSTRLVIAKRAFGRGGKVTLEKIGSRTSLEYSEIERHGKRWLEVRYTNRDGAAVGKRAVPILQGEDDVARPDLDRRAAYDLAELMINDGD